MKDYFEFTGKTVVVTGAASGMGKAAAEMLVDLGARVWALDWAEVEVEGVEKYIHTDLSRKESIDEAFACIPQHIDSYFGIAGVAGTRHDALTTLTINFLSNKYICEEYLIHRMEQGGSIAFMTSTGGLAWKLADNKEVYLPYVEASGWENVQSAIAGSVMGHLPGTLAYPCSKMAMNYYVAKAQELFAPKGVRVNAVMPGSTDTGLKGDFLAMNGSDMDKLLKGTGAIKRLATSEEMAEPIVFLNSNMARFISGDIIVIDYGYSITNEAGIVQSTSGDLNLKNVIAMVMQQAQQRQQ